MGAAGWATSTAGCSVETCGAPLPAPTARSPCLAPSPYTCVFPLWSVHGFQSHHPILRDTLMGMFPLLLSLFSQPTLWEAVMEAANSPVCSPLLLICFTLLSCAAISLIHQFMARDSSLLLYAISAAGHQF